MSVADVPLGPIVARCATHPEEAASGTCTRCGTFYCEQCRQDILGTVYCGTCAQRPDINYLELFRLKLWGRRDSWAWTIGFCGVGLAGYAGVMAVNGLYVPGLATAACAGVCVAFFLGMAWSRLALILAPLGFAAVCVVLGHAPTLIPLGLLFLAALAVYGNTRNQLFFRQEVPVPRLQRLWHLLEDNRLARHAMSFGLGGLFLPLFALVAIVLGVAALRRVNPDVMPPVGRKGQSIAAIVLGLVMTGVWLVVLWPVLSRLISE
jgi:cytochrome c oxidase subunit IV